MNTTERPTTSPDFHSGDPGRSILCFEEVSYSYPGTNERALQDLSIEINEGEFCLLAGLSGHGKSTFLKAACGLVPHFCGGRFAGRVTLAGLDSHNHTPAQLGQFAGMLFQDPETQLVMNSVRAELALALENRGDSAAAVARGVEEVALALGIDGLLERSTHELSGGEKQRVALGAALVGRPRVVLLDEPTSQLDPVAGDELIGLLRRLNQEWEITIVLSEHRLERCLGAADRVIALQNGRVGYDGDPQLFLQWAQSSARALQTPGAKLFSLSGLSPAPVSVKQARACLRREGLLPVKHPPRDPAARGRHKARKAHKRDLALDIRGIWHELDRGKAILRGVDLDLKPGENIALMGRNGAGKSTLLRHAAGLLQPTRGKIHRAGRVALLLQNPSDYLVHERVSDEVSGDSLIQAGLQGLSNRNPRDLSGGERQRLALAIVSGGDPPAVLALDEPTRGMDRQAKATLVQELHRRSAQGQAIIVATHDPEFAAECAERAVLLADGRVIADGPISELLAGGWYFATETARILGGAAGALLAEDGARALARQSMVRVSE